MIKSIAEWSQQELLFLSIPHEKTDWQPYLDEILASYENLVSVVSKFQKVALIAPNYSDFARFEKFQNVEFLQIPTNDTWIRDYGAIDVFSGDKIISYDFIFNAWGAKFKSDLDNAVNSEIFKHFSGELRKIPFILEGGSVEFNGAGTMLTTKNCLLNANRNATLSRAQIEAKLKDLFGLKSVIWLENGFIRGDDTDSHIDTLARFIDETTIAYAACEDKSDEHFLPLKKMRRELENTGFSLVPLPLPRAVNFENRRLGATYCNFIFINDALIVPLYGDENADKIALSRLSKSVKNRQIIGVDARVFLRQNGSLHCASQNRFLGQR